MDARRYCVTVPGDFILANNYHIYHPLLRVKQKQRDVKCVCEDNIKVDVMFQRPTMSYTFKPRVQYDVWPHPDSMPESDHFT